MKSTLVIAPDWPGDEAVLILDAAEWAALHQHLATCDAGQVGDRHLVIMDRVGFRALERYVSQACAIANGRGVLEPQLRLLDGCLTRLGEAFARARRLDQSGDPRPGSDQAVRMAEAG